MSPQELYREEKARRRPVDQREWREHLRVIEQQEQENRKRHRPTQGEGRGLFHQKLYE